MPTQRYGGKTVLEAARERMAFVFENFETVLVSISGGKDSTVLAHLALVEARRRQRRVGLFFLDEEAVYQSTIDQVSYLVEMFPETAIVSWLQLPFRLTNATSVEEGQLECWEPGKHAQWMRPRRKDSIHHPPWDRATETVRDRRKGFGFYDAIENWERTLTGAGLLVGLRAAGESPNRWRTVTKHPVDVGGRSVYWATRKGPNTVLYPIYDWNFHDVWRYIHDEQLRYSKVYDWQFKKGYPISEMRVSSLIHERSFKALVDLPEFEPKTFAKLSKRIKGIALAQEAGKAAKLFRCRTLPKNFTSWIVYRDFLLKTHSDELRRPIFDARFARQRHNEYVARQQCRQLILNDYENNLAIDDAEDPRDALIRYYDEVL